MRGKRTDSKTVADIVTKKLENPDLSTRDIWEDLWLHHNTVWQILNKELGQISATESGRKLIDVNVSIIAKGKELIDNYLPALEIKSYSDLTHISGITETAFKQNRLIEEKSTENVNVFSDVLKDIQGMNVV